VSAGERGKGFEGEETEGKDKRVGTRGGGGLTAERLADGKWGRAGWGEGQAAEVAHSTMRGLWGVARHMGPRKGQLDGSSHGRQGSQLSEWADGNWANVTGAQG
jgi:hypothetical protein